MMGAESGGGGQGGLVKALDSIAFFPSLPLQCIGITIPPSNSKKRIIFSSSFSKSVRRQTNVSNWQPAFNITTPKSGKKASNEDTDTEFLFA